MNTVKTRRSRREHRGADRSLVRVVAAPMLCSW
jgi:hypothetical protein